MYKQDLPRPCFFSCQDNLYFPSSSLSSRFRILPEGFLGRFSAMTIFLGHLNPARCSLQWAMISFSVRDDPFFGTITAATISIHLGSGRPMTATSSMPGLGALAGDLGCFPLDYEAYPPQSHCHALTYRHSEFS